MAALLNISGIFVHLTESNQQKWCLFFVPQQQFVYHCNVYLVITQLNYTEIRDYEEENKQLHIALSKQHAHVVLLTNKARGGVVNACCLPKEGGVVAVDAQSEDARPAVCHVEDKQDLLFVAPVQDTVVLHVKCNGEGE